MATTDPSKTPAAPAAEPDELSRLTSEVASLRKKNAQLRTELENARAGRPADRQEFVPDWIPQGTAVELEQNGRAVNPFNGERLGDWTDVDAAEAKRTGRAGRA